METELERAQRLLDEAEINVKQQRQLVGELIAQGHTARLALEMLKTLIDYFDLRKAELERLTLRSGERPSPH